MKNEVTYTLKLALRRVENILEEVENAGYHQPASSPFPTLFKKALAFRIIIT